MAFSAGTTLQVFAFCIVRPTYVRFAVGTRTPATAARCSPARSPPVAYGHRHRHPAAVAIYVWVDDLEDELIRAVGTAGVEALFDSQGDLGSFRSLQSQPAWRGREPEAQMRRLLGSGSRRKPRYARLLVEAAIGHDALPRPLDELVTAV